MYNPEFEKLDTEDIEINREQEDIADSFESSFTYHAVPLDEQMTLDDNGIPFTLKELMELEELREDLDDDK